MEAMRILKISGIHLVGLQARLILPDRVFEEITMPHGSHSGETYGRITHVVILARRLCSVCPQNGVLYTFDSPAGYTRRKTGRLRQEEEEVSQERQLLNASKLESLIAKLCKTESACLD